MGTPEVDHLGLAERVVPGADLDAAAGDLVAALFTVEPALARATMELLQRVFRP